MGRYEELLKSMKNQPTAEDETAKPNSPRNALAGAVNPLIDKYVNANLPESIQVPHIPEMTVADEKRWANDLPQQMGLASMGSIQSVREAMPAASRFGKILQTGQGEAQNLGKVSVVPTAEELASDAIRGSTKPLKADAVRTATQEQYGAELAKRKADMLKGLITPEAYQSFKQEMVNKLRGPQ